MLDNAGIKEVLESKVALYQKILDKLDQNPNYDFFLVKCLIWAKN